MKEFIEKLIGRLEERRREAGNWSESDDDYFSGKEYACEDSIKIVNQLAEEYNNGWIPVSERLPERNKYVLCYAKSTARDGDTWFVGSYDNGFWFLQTAIGTLAYPTQYEVVAWQPLPAPYQPKGGE